MISSFVLMSFCPILFIFCLYFCLLNNFEIFGYIVESLIGIQHIFLKVQLKNENLKSVVLRARVQVPKLVYQSPKWPRYVLRLLMLNNIWWKIVGLFEMNYVSLFSILFGIHYLAVLNILLEINSLINSRDVDH